MSETVEQLKARLEREDEEKEEAFQKRLEEIKAGNARWRAKKEAEARAEQQERQRLHEDLRQNRENDMKDSARSSWLAAGGTEAEFEEEWPSIRTQMLREHALEGDFAARRETRGRGIRAF